MAGLTDEGFTAPTLTEIESRIKAKLELLNPGFDFSIESPDGQNIAIFGFEIEQLWQQLSLVYRSNDPSLATGQALRNIGQLSGVFLENADRSYAVIGLVGTEGTVVPAGKEVSDAYGNVFVTEFEAVIPTNVGAIAVNAGPTPVFAGRLVNIDTPVYGWDSITHTVDGDVGEAQETEQEFRNKRNKTVMAPASNTAEFLRGQLVLLGISQVEVVNNDTIEDFADGTPVGYIHIKVTENELTDLAIAENILKYKSLGTPTYGTTAVTVLDSQGNSHIIYFSKAQAVPMVIELNITFLSTDIAGAKDSIKAALFEYVNALGAGEDIIWSHMFGLITPYGSAQINELLVSAIQYDPSAGNVVVYDGEFATIDSANITITET